MPWVLPRLAVYSRFFPKALGVCLRPPADLFQLTLWLAGHHLASNPGFEFPHIQSTLGSVEPSAECGVNTMFTKRNQAEETEQSG